MTAVYFLAQPETNGVIAPILVAGSRQDPQQPAGIGYRPFLPIGERIDTLCRRVKRWVTLRRTANRDKRITFVLHNNPCKGMEATVGMAVGLDAFESMARVLRQMKKAGYDVGMPPDTGGTAKILATILRTPPPDLPDLATLCAWSGNITADAYEGAAALIGQILRGGPAKVPEEHLKSLVPYCKAVAEHLARCDEEIDRLLQGLDGRYISPGLSGAVSRGNPAVLPTGRNFYATDVTILPTRTA